MAEYKKGKVEIQE